MSTTRPNTSTSAPNPQPPEPRSGNQVDIATRESSSAPVRPKATQFDGSPQPQPAKDGTFGPADDTPAALDKRSGPKNPGAL